MRAALRYGLVATLAASTWAAFSPVDTAPLPGVEPRASSRTDLALLPDQLAQPGIKPTSIADPFSWSTSPSAATSAPALVLPSAVVALPPPPPAPSAAPAPPSPPSLGVRFVGLFVSPAGERRLFVTAGGGEVSLALGDKLANGFVLTKLEPRQALFVHEGTGNAELLVLPSRTGP